MYKRQDLWVARTNKDKGLAHVSNAKLLRLHATFAEVKEKFGTREKLIGALLELEKRGKDTGLRQKQMCIRDRSLGAHGGVAVGLRGVCGP